MTVRIIHTHHHAFRTPTGDELRQLLAIVSRAYPQLGPGRYEASGERQIEENFSAFRAAFYAVGQLGRRDTPETKDAHGAMWWLDFCKQLL